MTLSEFKAWLDGFGEAIDGAPTPEQWERIKEKLAGIEGTVASPYYVPQTSVVPLDRIYIHHETTGDPVTTWPTTTC